MTRARGERDLRGDVHGGGRRHPPLPRARASWSATSGSIRGSASRARARPTHGRISKQGSAPARHALVEASWSAVRQPGPLRAFYERIRARRGHQVAIVAAARKLACLFWCLLTREEDYAFAQPSLTRKKLRRLELRAGAPSAQGRPHAGPGRPTQSDARGRARARPAGRGRLPAHGRRLAATQAKRKGAGATPGRASRGPSSGQAARQVQAPGPAL